MNPFVDSYNAIMLMEDLLTKTEGLLGTLPTAIQQAFQKYHNEPATIQHCPRWGLQALKEIRSDWHNLVADVPCCERGEPAKGEI